MFTTFNMGIGMMLFIEKSRGDAALEALNKAGYSPYIIGEVADHADEKVRII